MIVKHSSFLPLMANIAFLSSHLPICVSLSAVPSEGMDNANQELLTIPPHEPESYPKSRETQEIIFSSTECKSNESLAKITIKTDTYAFETSWVLRDVTDLNKIIERGPPENTNYARDETYIGTLCLTKGHEYLMKIKDLMGDGMCCSYGEGFITLEIDNGTTAASSSMEVVVSHTGRKNGYVRNYEFEVAGDDPTKQPTRIPTKPPTRAPTKRPTRVPTKKPTKQPTRIPTKRPTRAPTKGPTRVPTKKPTEGPTKGPTRKPTLRPTNQPAGPEKVVSFIVMADVPYYTNHRYCLNQQLRQLDPAIDDDFLFIIHLGDMKSGQTRTCEPEMFSDVAEIFANERNALHYDTRDVFFLIGDNDWNDCSSPSQAFSYWMNNFGNGKKTNGLNTGPNPYGFGTMSDPNIEVDYDFQGNQQSSQIYPSSASNLAFFYEGVLFVGLNQVGGSYVGDESERVANNFNWVRTNMAKYKSQGMRTLIVFAHAHMGSARYEYFGRPFQELLRSQYPDMLVVYMHGDGHEFDVGFVDSNNRNLIQIELDSGELADPILVSVTRDASEDVDVAMLDRRGGRYKNGDCSPDNRDKTWSSNLW